MLPLLLTTRFGRETVSESPNIIAPPLLAHAKARSL
jgi:hypothetical protein